MVKYFNIDTYHLLIVVAGFHAGGEGSEIVADVEPWVTTGGVHTVGLGRFPAGIGWTAVGCTVGWVAGNGVGWTCGCVALLAVVVVVVVVAAGWTVDGCAYGWVVAVLVSVVVVVAGVAESLSSSVAASPFWSSVGEVVGAEVGAVVEVGVGVVVAVGALGGLVGAEVGELVVEGEGWSADCGLGWLGGWDTLAGGEGGVTGGWGVEGAWVLVSVLTVTWAEAAAGSAGLVVSGCLDWSDWLPLPLPKLPQKLFHVSINPSWYSTSCLMWRELAQ